MVNKKQTNITVKLIAKRRVICIRPTMPQEKKTLRKGRKYLEPKKYEVFKKKEATHVREYRLKRMSEQLQVSTAVSTSKTTPTTSSASLSKQILSRSVHKTERSLIQSAKEDRGDRSFCQKIQYT